MRPRSYLYAPGHRPEVIAKALAGEADVVVADLEDAVPADRKAAARANVAAALADAPAGRLHVRVNPVGSAAGKEDLQALAGPVVVRLPKVEGPEDVRAALALLGASTAVLSCLLESAAGVEAAYAIATADPRVVAIALGEADLRADLGVSADAGLAYPRSRVVVAARAAGLARPVQSVFTDVGDLDGLRRTSLAGRALGFHGRSCVHPAQVPVINDAFTPSAAELAEALELAQALEAAGDEGSAVLPDGRFVDRAVVEAARELLEVPR